MVARTISTNKIELDREDIINETMKNRIPDNGK
jgi:hypothetical protein